ncbi:MAG: alpha/beta hydrolase [Bdellovibrionales bacterium]
MVHLFKIWKVYQSQGTFHYFSLFFRIPSFWSRNYKLVDTPHGAVHFYQAPQPTAPCILVVFGGAFKRGSPDQLVHLLAALRAEGFHVAALPYPTLPTGVWPKNIEDLVAVAHHVMNMQREGFSPREFHLMGRSAGGFLCLALSSRLKQDSRIRSVTALYPICDLKLWAEEKGAKEILSSHEIVPALLEDWNSSTVDLRDFEQSSSRRYFVATGDFDRFVDPHHSYLLKTSLEAQGCQVFYRVYPLQNHGFDVSISSLAGQLFWQDLLQTLLGQKPSGRTP